MERLMVLQLESGSCPVEAQLTRGAQGYNGTIVVTLGSGGAP